MAGDFKSFLSAILPRRQAKGGKGLPGTYNPSSPQEFLTRPTYQEHLTDIYSTRAISDSRALLQDLFKQDPDASAALNAYLTIANQKPMFFAYSADGTLAPDGMALVNQVISLLTKQFDYTLGFTYKPSLSTICENMRYMLLLRGGIGAELVFDKRLAPSDIRHVDLSTVQWKEKNPGVLKPTQVVNGTEINLDLPTFFTAFFHRDPTEIYTYSPFVSAINTIASRQQVINDLYRIMQLTGYPRMDVSIVEDVVRKSAPVNVQNDQEQLRVWMNARLSEVQALITNIRPDQAFVHWDSVQAGMVNDKKPGATLDITAVIETLNAQNQAALKTMATIIGRGESGVNTGTVEARVFSMNADELNHPIAEILSHILTLAIRLQGFDGYVECQFRKVEMRPELELEPHLMIKQSRLLENLSLGIITDDQYHIEMFGHPAPPTAPQLSGTNFMQPNPKPDTSGVSPNSDPLGRSVTPDGSKTARSKTVKK